MDIIQSIIAIKSDARVSVDNDDINKITWHDGNPTNITNEQILAKQTELKNTYDNNAYQRSRQAEYPTIVDQLDDIFHNGIDGWKATIQAIKDKYPKE
tara:strand:+ start:579 stop:872 length:294 start_codon:yes stop_codon:yes gene_type:complete